mmetsp:Transcript_13111/g.39906  ORF Transcript_13111/g.39906 Transcript_13111/m.39906 type:complete len:204 (+) Transcript_13111:535-1146(+)
MSTPRWSPSTRLTDCRCRCRRSNARRHLRIRSNSSTRCRGWYMPPQTMKLGLLTCARASSTKDGRRSATSWPSSARRTRRLLPVVPAVPSARTVRRTIVAPLTGATAATTTAAPTGTTIVAPTGTTTAAMIGTTTGATMTDATKTGVSVITMTVATTATTMTGAAVIVGTEDYVSCSLASSVLRPMLAAHWRVAPLAARFLGA